MAKLIPYISEAPRNGAVSVEVAAALYARWPGAQQIITTKNDVAVFPQQRSVYGDGFQQVRAQYSESVRVAGVEAVYVAQAHTIVVFNRNLRQRVARLRKVASEQPSEA